MMACLHHNTLLNALHKYLISNIPQVSSIIYLGCPVINTQSCILHLQGECERFMARLHVWVYGIHSGFSL